MSANEWADAIAGVISKTIQEVPEGFFTMKEIAEKIGRKMTQTKSLVQTMLSEGKAEMKTFYIKTKKNPYPVPHYRLLK